MAKEPSAKRCGIVGCLGQDGTLLRQQLEAAGHSISGLAHGDLDLTDRGEIARYLDREKLDELYYLPAYHHSSEDLMDLNEAEIFERSFATHVHGLISFLEAIRQSRSPSRLFYAASSHVFGVPEATPQNESTPFRPNNVYGISKAAGVEACRYYRKKYGVFASTGILYNHESALRAEKFVAKKIILGALRIAHGKQDHLKLGNLDATVDWGFAPDYTRAMTHLLSLDQPDDYVIATGEAHTVREFVEITFSTLQLDWRKHVKTDSSILTKSTTTLVGDATKLRSSGWQPTVDFPTMVRLILSEVRTSGAE